MLKKFSLYFHTLKYLKWVQIRYRCYYLIRNKIYKIIGSPLKTPLVGVDIPPKTRKLRLALSIPSYNSWSQGDQFTFLNLSNKFGKSINWNYSKFGKLWVYNLNYFEYLNQPNLPIQEGERLINNYIDSAHLLHDGLEPFPISLRIINWVKFLTYNNISTEKINRFLFDQLSILTKNLEYHILGNHLLENGFALLFGGMHFNNRKIIQYAENILMPELKEQILQDGGHFERSPMYHQIMLFRVLDSINIITSNKDNEVVPDLLIETLNQTASRMISWLNHMTYHNGDIPLLNDSANGIAPKSEELVEYAKRLNVENEEIELCDSGYKKIITDKIELVLDLGEVGPTYQPGHAHSDTFSFELRIDRQPFLVDTGTSTYEKSPRRQLERATSSHNTVKVGSEEQSEIWGGFRVGRRAIPKITQFSENQITAEHYGFRKNGYRHERTFIWKENKLEIIDIITNTNESCQAFFHFHPTIKLNLLDNAIDTSKANITTIGEESIEIQRYLYADKFNNTIASKKLVVTFKGELRTSISW